MFNAILFTILSTIALVAAVAMVTRRHPLSSALALIVVMVALSGLYALLLAPFLAILQILVYAGAILALVVFVIMLLNVREEDLEHEAGVGRRVGFALVVAFLLFWPVGVAILGLPMDDFPAVAADFGTMSAVGLALFRDWWFPFELVSLLLTVAIVGAVVLAKRKLDDSGAGS
ncbi:MAG: NADH-quinone oxidoreductase subunit J [Candidatus Sericytochromatia bacterium]|nr:NADH-quinone oxidoreductase subunit J [Candidatus Tanganyikabacteria bacterium]